MGDIKLSPETFRALASETRLDLLKALDTRKRTGTELAEELGLNKATVHEHLQVLIAVGLVRRLDEGRKWIYHELTWEGRNLLHPQESAVFRVLLGLGTLLGAGSILQIGKALGWWLVDRTSSGEDLSIESQPSADGTEMAGAEDSAMLAPDNSTFTPDDADEGFFTQGGTIALLLLLSSLLMVGLAIRLRTRHS